MEEVPVRFGHDPDTSERAQAVDLGLVWDRGAPSPHLVQGERRTFLAFYLSNLDPAWDGTRVKIMDPASEQLEPIGVVEWLGCGGAVLGGLNDEAFHGHPLWSRGLANIGPYAAAEIAESCWVREYERANSVHPSHRPEAFGRLRHYLLGFHDSTFECIAEGYVSYRVHDSMPAVLSELARRVLDDEPLAFDVIAHQEA